MGERFILDPCPEYRNNASKGLGEAWAGLSEQGALASQAGKRDCVTVFSFKKYGHHPIVYVHCGERILTASL